MHEKGPMIVQYGSIYPKDGSFSYMINNLFMIINKEWCSVLKYGEMKVDVPEYYEKIREKYSRVSPEDADNIILITFDRYDGILDIDEICTLGNYFLNHVGEGMLKIFDINETELKEKIKKLQEYGF